MDTRTAVPALAALAQPSRLSIFRWLVELGPEGACPGDIAEKLDLPAATPPVKPTNIGLVAIRAGERGTSD